MPYSDYAREEVSERGEEIYAREIKGSVEPEEKGKFVVIDIETGEYEIDKSDLAATKSALAKRPEAVLHGIRIGYRTAHNLGGRITIVREP